MAEEFYGLSSHDKAIRSKVGGKKSKKSYHRTLLLAFFLGAFGVHRFINGKKISGVIMLVSTITIPPCFMIALAFAYDGKETVESVPLMIVTTLLFLLLFSLWLWVSADVVVIMSGNFTDWNNEEKIHSGKNFFLTWSNYIVLLVVYSMVAVFFVESLTFEDSAGDTKTVVEEKEDKEIGNKYLSSIEDCIVGSHFEFESYSDFDETNQYLENLGYDLSKQPTYTQGSIYRFTKDFDKGLITLTMVVKELDDTIDVSYCNFTSTNNENDDSLYTIVSDVMYDSNILMVTGLESVSNNTGYYAGKYLIDKEEFELEYLDNINDYELEAVPYDTKIDERGIIDTFQYYIGKYIEEYNNIFG